MMNLSSRCKGGACWFINGLILLGLAGCSSVISRGDISYHSEIPQSNMHIGEMVLECALNNARIPPGHGAEVICAVDGENEASNLLRIIVPEFLLKHGYRIRENEESIPVFRFHADTLYVNLDLKSGKHRDGMVRRYSEACIGAVLQETSGFNKVYQGRGTYEDTFPIQILYTVKGDESFVAVLPAQDRIKEKLKPFFWGIIMTALVWSLYFYRG